MKRINQGEGSIGQDHESIPENRCDDLTESRLVHDFVRLRDDLTDTQAFHYEAILWSQLSHPNILPLYGMYFLDDRHSQLCLVSPWMEKGNIRDYLQNLLERDDSVTQLRLVGDL